jgi:stearoyl-CoA desaturase (delta-9 desaturase)
MATNFAEIDEVENWMDPDTVAPRRARLGLIVGGPEARAKRREYAFYAITKNGGFLVAIWWILTQSSGWVEWSAFALFYLLNILSMSLAYHRYFTHRAFETSLPMRYALGILAQFGVYGSLLRWTADHRRHHAMSDRPGDIHSPYVDPHGTPLAKWKGLSHAHLGWVFDNTTTDLAVYGRGLVHDPVMIFCHRTRYFWYAVSALALPALWGWALGGTGAILGTILIAGFFRIQLALHAIAAVNSFGHRFGRERFSGNHSAKNNWFIALITLGEGWHNNHHEHPRAAGTGFVWYEIDPTGWLIRLMEKMGLVWNVRAAPRYVRDAEGRWTDAGAGVAA